MAIEECMGFMLRDLEESQLSIEQIADKYCVCKTPELKDLLITSLKVFKDNIKKTIGNE